MQAEEDRDALLVKAKEGDVDAIINWLKSLRAISRIRIERLGGLRRPCFCGEKATPAA